MVGLLIYIAGWKTKPVSIGYDKPMKLTKFQKFNVMGFTLEMGSGGR